MKQRDRHNPREREVKIRFNDEELSLIDSLAEFEGIHRAALIREIAMRRAHQIKVMKQFKHQAA